MRRTLSLLALVAMGALPREAAALELGARAGFDWTRQDDWTPNLRTQSDRLLLDVGLRLRDFVYHPGAAWLRGRADLRLDDQRSGGTTNARVETFTYDLSGAVFQHRGSPFTLTFDAARLDSETSGATAGTFGTRTTDSAGASAALTLPGRPHANVAYSWSRQRSEFSGLPDNERTLQRLRTGASHSTPSFSFRATYEAERSEGDWLGENYALNGVVADVSASMGSDLTFDLSDQYYQRSPTTRFDLALASELHSLQAALRKAAGTSREQVGTYLYQRAFQSFSALGATESVTHRANYSKAFPIGESRFALRASLGAAAVEQRTAAALSRSTGETLSSELLWLRRDGSKVDEIRGGPSVGLLQEESGPDRVGYGGSLVLSTSRPIRGLRANARYDLRYGKDIGGVPGWSLSQSVLASAAGDLGRGILTGQLQANAARSWSPTFGDAASRTVQLSADWSARPHSLRATVSVGSGIAGNPADRFVGDGLLLPAPFDTHSVAASLTAATGGRGFVASATLGYATSTAPGQPSLTQYQANAAVGYAFASFAVSLEDRISLFDSSGGRTTINVVLFRITRSFGSAF